MSVYMIDKFMRTVQMDREALLRYSKDREAYVAEWEAGAGRLPVRPDGGTLTAEERQALIELDHARLYTMGAHPYMLWHFVADVMTLTEMPRADVIELYRTAIEESGHPSFAT